MKRHAQPGTAQSATHGAWRWATAGLLLGAVASLLVFAPARWLQGTVAEWSNGHLQMAETEGTLWAGSTRLVLTGGAGSQDFESLPGRVSWSTGWASGPQALALSVALRVPCCSEQALQWVVRPRWQGATVQLEAAQSRWPLAVLAGLGTPWNSVQAEGMAVLHNGPMQWDVSLQRWQVEGRAQLDIEDLASRLSTLRPLGSYRVNFEGGQQPHMELQTLQGALQLRGQGQWQGGHLRFSGEAQAAPSHEAELSNLLNILGRRNGDRSIIQLG